MQTVYVLNRIFAYRPAKRSYDVSQSTVMFNSFQWLFVLRLVALAFSLVQNRWFKRCRCSALLPKRLAICRHLNRLWQRLLPATDVASQRRRPRHVHHGQDLQHTTSTLTTALELGAECDCQTTSLSLWEGLFFCFLNAEDVPSLALGRRTSLQKLRNTFLAIARWLMCAR